MSKLMQFKEAAILSEAHKQQRAHRVRLQTKLDVFAAQLDEVATEAAKCGLELVCETEDGHFTKLFLK